MKTDVIIIGAGVIGLSIAREISQNGFSVVILEKESSFGQGSSSRNSEVIHAGVYYKTNSLKALLSIRGKELLYEYCKTHNIPYKRIGKLFVAVDDDEIPQLEKTKKQGESNGLDDLILLDRDQLRDIEPEILGVQALFSPSSGVFDSHAFMQSLLQISEDNGAIFSHSSPFMGAEIRNDGWKVSIGGVKSTSIDARIIINAAGLYSTQLTKDIFPERKVPELIATKGCYLKYSGKSPLQHIVYPAITPGQIEERVDATPDLNGILRFGPNVEIPKSLHDYTINSSSVDQMKSGIKRYLPNIDESRLHPDFAGIRPKISIPGESVCDFQFDWNKESNWLDLWGMESPGLTSSLAIAEHVWGLIQDRNVLH
jgi:L-2-hydroxyglutarate oxidase LhgO